MPKRPNQKKRTLLLAKMFLEQSDEDHGITMNQIQEMLEKEGIPAERKAIYDDIQTLGEVGMDICSCKNGRNYYYYLTSREFELSELKLMVDSIQAAKFLSEEQSQELITKLEGLTSSHQANELRRNVSIAGRVKMNNLQILNNVDLLQQALNDNLQVEFLYCQWTLEKKKEPRHNGRVYQISPWNLIWDDEYYYLAGYDMTSRSIKHFRVDKMIQLSLTSLPRKGKEAYEQIDPFCYSRGLFGMFTGTRCKVRMEADNFLIGALIDRFGTGIWINPVSESRFQCVVDVTLSDRFYAWVTGFGSHLEVMSPPEARLGMKTLLQNTLSAYQKEETEKKI